MSFTDWFFLTQIIEGILIIILLQMIIQLKKQVNEIIKEVKEYVTFITEDTENDIKSNEIHKKVDKDEVQAHLIQAVLDEYFP